MGYGEMGPVPPGPYVCLNSENRASGPLLTESLCLESENRARPLGLACLGWPYPVVCGINTRRPSAALTLFRAGSERFDSGRALKGSILGGL